MSIILIVMNAIPLFVPAFFGLVTLATLVFFFYATNRSKTAISAALAWLIFQSAMGISGFYLFTSAMPPRFVFSVGPPLLIISLLFITKRGRVFIDSLNLKTFILLHVIRIPVELALFALFSFKVIPELMTFDGRNFDILSGVTAPFIYYFGFVKQGLGNRIILLWNLICLGLLINIVIIAILSAPFQFQKLAFDQPNIAVLYFPYVWLPSFIVPVVLFSHLVSIRSILLSNGKTSGA